MTVCNDYHNIRLYVLVQQNIRLRIERLPDDKKYVLAYSILIYEK